MLDVSEIQTHINRWSCLNWMELWEKKREEKYGGFCFPIGSEGESAKNILIYE